MLQPFNLNCNHTLLYNIKLKREQVQRNICMCMQDSVFARKKILWTALCPKATKMNQHNILYIYMQGVSGPMIWKTTFFQSSNSAKNQLHISNTGNHHWETLDKILLEEHVLIVSPNKDSHPWYVHVAIPTLGLWLRHCKCQSHNKVVCIKCYPLLLVSILQQQQ